MSRQQGPVLSSEAAASDGGVRAEGDPHGAAVGVHCRRSRVTTEPTRMAEG